MNHGDYETVLFGNAADKIDLAMDADGVEQRANRVYLFTSGLKGKAGRERGARWRLGRRFA